MEERVDPPVVVEPVFQIEPAAHGVHRLQAGEPFEQRRGVGPGQPPQLEQAQIDPRGEERAQVFIERREVRDVVALLHELQDRGAQIDDEAQVARYRGHVGQHVVASGLQRGAQLRQRGPALDRVGGRRRIVEPARDARRIDVQRVEQPQDVDQLGLRRPRNGRDERLNVLPRAQVADPQDLQRVDRTLGLGRSSCHDAVYNECRGG